jgi:tartrate dehydrogenase/decarboxylase/D-malate dehydrogenase
VYRIAAIGGDGIGPEILHEGKKVLDAAADRFGFTIEWQDFPIGADRYLSSGELITEEELQELGRFNAIYFGAIGDERVRTGILEKGILLALRFYFDQYINLRPIKLLPGVCTPLAGKTPEEIDFLVVRENTEDFYVGIGSRFRSSREQKTLEIIRTLYTIRFGLDVESDADEIAYQIGVISREGAKRVITYAFEQAERRRKKLTSVDKANVLSDIYGLWRDVFSECAGRHPGVVTEFAFVDAITMWFVKNPEWFDVVVTPNISPGGVSMFEPIHGSAPKYKGLNIANPFATIWAGSMLLDHIGEHAAAEQILQSVSRAILDGVMTKDMGGSGGTNTVGDYVANLVKKG